MQTRLDRYNNSWYRPGGSLIRQILWYFVNQLVFRHGLLPLNFLKCFLLKLFGARIGKGVVIKPNVNIKYPWRLKVGHHVWIGEQVWIDNLDDVIIGDHVCISQGAMLLCGNHNYKKPTFDLIVGKIILEEGVWIGAQTVVCPGVICKSHSLLTVGSVATQMLASYKIYQGNPAKAIRDRKISN
jgi:putative colanic acid biosynthesis acetyltransferase WcaF